MKELMRKNVEKISSGQLSCMTGYTASQIRQDLNNFGGFGQQGYGYNVADLHREIGTILGLDQNYKMIIVGAGNMGQAIANYTYYYKSGFIVEGIFEINPRLVKIKINEMETARNLIRMGLDLTKIAEATGLPLEEIQALKKDGTSLTV